ncbi:CLUMA_CG014709, isoform A [Clunio marinus]|uniref:CLUMA_CG014709, isoform A n=1 Tax=Clunio marinus TaxID=568069 RepID=A0A1J1IM15_9DIPT|nr:CLUMA_CG014709, isoform A [Clunio marinus]
MLDSSAEIVENEFMTSADAAYQRSDLLSHFYMDGSKLSQPRTSETLSQILNQKLKEEKDVLNTIAVVSFVLTDSNIYEQSLSYRLITSLCHTSNVKEREKTRSGIPEKSKRAQLISINKTISLINSSINSCFSITQKNFYAQDFQQTDLLRLDS